MNNANKVHLCKVQSFYLCNTYRTLGALTFVILVVVIGRSWIRVSCSSVVKSSWVVFLILPSLNTRYTLLKPSSVFIKGRLPGKLAGCEDAFACLVRPVDESFSCKIVQCKTFCLRVKPVALFLLQYSLAVSATLCSGCSGFRQAFRLSSW